MIRLVLFLLLALVVATVMILVINQTGTVTINWLDYYIETDIGFALIVIGLIVIAIIGILVVILLLFNLPSMIYRFIFKRRKHLGYDALSRGLIALGSGDNIESKKIGLYAEKLIKQEPAVQLLLAQVAQASGDQADAKMRFERLLANKATKLLGLHGLYIESMRQKDLISAQHYAGEAFQLSPKLPWANKAVLTFQANAGEWEGAVATLTQSYQSKLIDKSKYYRQKAVLMTAWGLEIEMGEPDRARTLALDSHKIAPSLVPAAVLASRLCIRRGELRRANKILQTTWKKVPHPELADTYAHIRRGDTVRERYKRIQVLAAFRPNHSESSFALAKAAIEVQEFDEARAQLTRIIQSAPTQRAFLLMAKIEESESDNQGAVREWLSRAVHAPKDFMWIADGIEFQNWHAVSPISGKIDAFEWRKPTSKLPIPEIEAKNFRNTTRDANQINEKSESMLKITAEKSRVESSSDQTDSAMINASVESPRVLNSQNSEVPSQDGMEKTEQKSSVFSVKAPISERTT